jgi:hypothetical protein
LLIAKQTRTVTITTTSPSSSFRSDSNIATITNVQLPGIHPNNNRSSPPASSSNFGSNIISNSNPSTNNHQSSATTTTPPLVHRNTRARHAIGGPTLNDPNLKVEQIINTGLKSTTSMAFLGPNDILVLEKDTGIVHRILNGKILLQHLLDVNVANEAERGLLGIAIANGSNDENAENENRNANTDNIHVFLYYTESGGEKDGDDKPTAGGIAPAGNRLYRYYIHESGNDVKLTNSLLLLNLPASPPPERAGTEKNHNAGKVLMYTLV